MLDDYIWLWKVSNSMFNRRAHGGLKSRLAFMAKAFHISSSLQPFLHAAEGSPLDRLIKQRPETVGVIVWPYQCRTWDAKTRLSRIEAHYKVIEALSPKIDFPINGALKLMDLSDTYANLNVVLDQPTWFMREGQLVLNLFLGDMRIFSLAFSFACESGHIVAYIGAMQGKKVEDALDTYHDITKAMYGMRPRDLLFELFRALCRAIGVSKIFAVPDANRHHRSSYFGEKSTAAKYTLKYDEIWLERGGVLNGSDFYEFSVAPHQKNLDEVPSKKRAMYRRRYAFLAETEAKMQAVYQHIDSECLLECPFQSR
jgi:uncharacterized protein